MEAEAYPYENHGRLAGVHSDALYGVFTDGSCCPEQRKSLKGCIAALLTWSFKNAKPVDRDILRQANVSGQVSLGIPGMGRARQINTDYYLNGKEEARCWHLRALPKI